MSEVVVVVDVYSCRSSNVASTLATCTLLPVYPADPLLVLHNQGDGAKKHEDKLDTFIQHNIHASAHQLYTIKIIQSSGPVLFSLPHECSFQSFALPLGGLTSQPCTVYQVDSPR